MTIYLDRVEYAVGHGRLSEIEAAFEGLIRGEDLRSHEGDLLHGDERARLLAATAAVLANDDRPIPRSLAAVLHGLAPDALDAEPTFARAATIAIENADRIAVDERGVGTKATGVADTAASSRDKPA
jgi:hypothetical protein